MRNTDAKDRSRTVVVFILTIFLSLMKFESTAVSQTGIHSILVPFG